MKKHFCPYCMTPVKEGEPCAACGLTAGTYSSSPHHLPPGTILMERYLIGRVLGEGGFGITYIGCDLRLELKVAIKEYFPSDKVTRHSQASLEVSNYTGALAGNYERGKEKYLQEARTMARMNKQAEIVSVRDFFEANNTAYIVMEYVEGTTFKELVAQKGGRIPAGEFLHMIEPLFFALGVMHETGLIHRDISPDNLMLENGSVRLLDFGCARESAHGTETMTIALKHGYAPIEQYQHKGQGPWTDVYGLCATMYYCLTGKVPQQSLDRLCEDELILPRKLGVDLTENQERALLYGMGIRPRRRYQSVQELYAALYTGVPAPKIETGQISMFSPEIGQVPSETEREKTEETQAPGEGKEIRSGAETMSGEEREEKTDGREKKSSDEQEEGKQKKIVRQAGIAAMIVAIICLVCTPFLLQEKLRPVSNTDTEEEPTAEPTEPSEEIFAEAVSVDTASEAALREALNSEAKAVIWDRDGVIQLTDEPLVLTKPLLIGRDAHIENATQLKIEGGGLIQVEGDFENRGFLQVQGEGLIRITDGGTMHGSSCILLEKEENLVVKEGGIAELGGWNFADTGFDGLHFVVFSEEDVFADAAHVRTAQQLQDALDSGDIFSVVIEDDITLTRDCRYMSKSVMIREGVTVTADQKEEASVCFDGKYFVNRGTVMGTFQVGDWNEDGRTSNVVNYGTITNDWYVESDCNIFNHGQIVLGTGYMKVGSFYNLGRFVHDDSKEEGTYFDFLRSQVVNMGTICLEGSSDPQKEPVVMNFSFETIVYNQGLIEIGTGVDLLNEAGIYGYGQILATDKTSENTSGFRNTGVIRLEYASSAETAAALDLPEGMRFDNEGLICRSESSILNLPGKPEDYNGRVIPFAWGDDTEDTRWVSTGDELKEALRDDECGLVILCDNSEITLEGGLTLTKSVAMPWNAWLRFTDGNLTVTGKDTFVYGGNLEMNGKNITVAEEAVLCIDRLQSCGDILARDKGQIFLLNGEYGEYLPDSSVVLESGGRILDAGYNDLKDRDVSIAEGSVFRVIKGMNMENSRVTIQEGGELLIDVGACRIGEGVVITNNGKLTLGGFEVNVCEGEIINHNNMEITCMLYLDGGSFVNNGNIRINLGEESIRGDGMIENNGTILSLSRNLLRDFTGTYGGNEIRYES